MVQVKRHKISWFWLLNALLKSIDRYANTSHSQHGEDMTLLKIFENSGTGHFIDVGCNHPFKANNTYQLYMRGWSGLNIDANAGFAKAYKRHRPKDIFHCAAVAGDAREVVFYQHKDSKRSSLNKEISDSLNESLESKQRLQTETLTQILNNNWPISRAIDLLCIDVEGSDLEVLEGLDFEAFLPTWICIEISANGVKEVLNSPIYHYLHDRNYRLMHHQGFSAFFKLGA